MGAEDDDEVHSDGEFDFDAEDAYPTAMERKIERGFGMDEVGVGLGREGA